MQLLCDFWLILFQETKNCQKLYNCQVLDYFVYSPKPNEHLKVKTHTVQAGNLHWASICVGNCIAVKGDNNNKNYCHLDLGGEKSGNVGLFSEVKEKSQI